MPHKVAAPAVCLASRVLQAQPQAGNRVLMPFKDGAIILAPSLLPVGIVR